LVDEPFQKQGIGTEVVNRLKAETISRSFDVLFATTQNHIVEKMLTKLEFNKIDTELIWFNPQTKSYEVLEEEGYQPFAFIVDKNPFKGEESIFLGDGPI
jgi:GNAT superfamily N-acetyltransferase